MLNKAMIIGRLGKDPELKYTQSGTACVNLSLATDESYLDKDNNKVERAEWHRVVLFNKQAENAAKYLQKGSLIFIEGKIATRKWEDNKGEDRYTTEIYANTVKYLDNWKKDEKKSNEPIKGDYGQYEERSAFDVAPF